MDVSDLRSRVVHTACVVLLLHCALSAWAYAQAGGTRYAEKIFSSYQITSNVYYGATAVQVMDVYAPPADDADTLRPLLLYVHGGGFKNGDKVGNYQMRVCSTLTLSGYVTASINYRLTPNRTDDTVHFEAMLRALQDVRAAVRYFRSHSTAYGIDPARIFVTGSSAGSITALHLAFLDSSEVPAYVRWANVGGGFDAPNADRSIPATVTGVVNAWGAIGDTAWMTPGDPPVFSVHGLDDATVFYDSIPSDGPFLHSSRYITEAAERLGIPAGLKTFPGTGHTLDNNASKQLTAIDNFRAWLFTRLQTQTDVRDRDQGLRAIPGSPVLHQNFPNPFNPETTVRFDLPRDSFVRLSLVDLLGRKVRSLVSEQYESGSHDVVLHANGLASGGYILALTTQDGTDVRRIVLIR